MKGMEPVVRFEHASSEAEGRAFLDACGDPLTGRSGRLQRQIELMVPKGLATTGDGTVSFTVEVVDNTFADWNRMCRLGGDAAGEPVRFLSSGVAALEVPGDRVGRLPISLRFVDPGTGRVLVGHFGIPIRKYNETGIHVETSSRGVREHSVIYQPIEVNEVPSGALEIHEGEVRLAVTMVEEQLFPPVPLQSWARQERLTILPERGDGIVRAVGLHLGPSAVVGRCYASQLHGAARRRLRAEDERQVHWVTCWDDPSLSQLLARLRFVPGSEEARLEITNLSDYSKSPTPLELRGGGWGEARLEPGGERTACLPADSCLVLAAGGGTSGHELVRFRLDDQPLGDLACPVLTTEGTAFPFPPGAKGREVRLLAAWIPMRRENLERALAVTGRSLHLRFVGEDLHLALRFDSGRGGIILGANHPLEIS